MGVQKSVDKLPTRRPVESPEVLARLIGTRNAPPKVHAYELAGALGIDPSSLSLFENGRRALPGDLTVADYEQKVADLKRAKRLEGAA